MGMSSALKSRTKSTFNVGDAVVHPRHGAGRIVSHRRRRLLGTTRDYLEIDLQHVSMRILVPCDAASAVGLRKVIGRRRLQRVVDVLAAAPEPVPSGWSPRQKHYQAKLESGELLELAGIVRDLSGRAGGRDLSSTERGMLHRSRTILALEVGYALGIDIERAGSYIDKHITPAAG